MHIYVYIHVYTYMQLKKIKIFYDTKCEHTSPSATNQYTYMPVFLYTYICEHLYICIYMYMYGSK